ncbi:DUF2635 domain-containing protein [Bradyrhizobium sp. HKCCYLRH1073]|uniref:DUF2635 domain-containing protein n=1 Tax=unclassified Bradyrhizobium TaxID=2631580 RepID=UPI003EB783A7
MDNIFLEPALLAAGGVVLVRDPQTGVPLAASGEWKARSPYWVRRLRDGDVVEAQPPASAFETSTRSNQIHESRSQNAALTQVMLDPKS